MRASGGFAGVVALAVTAVAVAALGTLPGRVAAQEDPFPHARHQGLFPVCSGCHTGIASGRAEAVYPEASTCALCHDDTDLGGVTWRGPTRRVDNVVFDHDAHRLELEERGDAPQACASCHVSPGGDRMEVVAQLQTETCWGCHAHATEDHYDPGATCESCHIPLASTRFDRERIEDLPRPQSHRASDFVSRTHGRLAAEGSPSACATCHTQERCTTCHVDGDRAEIQRIPAAPASLPIPSYVAAYPEPVSHGEGSWIESHGEGASVGSCSTCHTTDDCRSCHVDPVPAGVESLPRRGESAAPGVMLEPGPPASHESMFFLQAHSILASASPTNCQTCHVERFCVECHDGPVDGGYHPANFTVRHAADAYGRDAECSSCHEARVFCRACHAEVGVAGRRRGVSGYHDASPVWLLQHGQAARQNLESCASCHRQVDCTRCHGVLGAFKVSPHRAGFDAERAWASSARTCLACHIGNPLRGGVP